MSRDRSNEPQRTVWGAAVISANYTRNQINYVENSTINEKFSVATEVGLEDFEIPYLSYWGFGRGSTYEKVLSDGSKETENYLHEPTNAVLHKQSPFVLARIGEDITPAKREQYAIRALVDIGGVNYIAYYLKKIRRDDESLVNAFFVTPETETTDEVETPLVGDPAYLNPVMKAVDDDTVRVDGSYTRVRSILHTQLDDWDIDQMINAKAIITGSTNLEITEVGLFSAFPKNYTRDGVTYTEAIKAQLNLISKQRIRINDYAKDGFTRKHDLGVDDPTTFNFLP